MLAVAVAAVPVGKAAGLEGTAYAVVGGHSRAFLGEDEEGAQTVAAEGETHTAAVVEETHTAAAAAAAGGEAHTVVAVAAANALFVVCVRI